MHTKIRLQQLKCTETYQIELLTTLQMMASWGLDLEKQGAAMAIKTTGAEFSAFYFDKEFWPGNTWHEDAEITIKVNGEPLGDDFDYDSNEVPDHAEVTLSGGVVTNVHSDNLGTLDAYFLKWKGKKDAAILGVDGA